MKISDHFNKGPVQDLLNAVVVQAAEDYREYSAKLLVQIIFNGQRNNL